MCGIKAGGAYRFSKPPFFILSIPFILSEHQPWLSFVRKHFGQDLQDVRDQSRRSIQIF